MCGALNQQQKQLSGANTLKANTKPQGLTATKPNVKADVLQQIQGKSSGDLKGAKAKVNNDVLKQIGAKSNKGTTTGENKANNDALDRSKNRAELQNFTAGNQQTKEGFAKSQIPGGNINGKAVPKTQSPSEFSQGNKHQPHNNLTTNYNAKSNSKNWNSSAGSQGTVKHITIRSPDRIDRRRR